MRIAERVGRHDGGSQSFAVAFSPSLLDPQSETPAAVTGPNKKAAVKRYNVYRNNVTVSPHRRSRGDLPGHPADHGRGILSRDGSFPRACHPADLAFAV
jgi:hypothetical protein